MPDYPTSEQIRARLQALRDQAANALFCTIVSLEQTHGAKPWPYLRVRKSNAADRPKFLVTGGVHGNEWAPPTSVLTFIEELLTAYHGNTAITKGGFTVQAQKVRDIVDRIDIYVAPICNPDGYDLSRSTIPANVLVGRKNGRPGAGACPGSGFHGVNINRNFDIVWAFDVKFAPGVLGTDASRDACSPNFIGPGPGPFTEPESRNIRAILDEGVDFYIDCHMFGPKIFHSWGIESNQTTDTNKWFGNAAFDGVRDSVPGNAYEEFITAADLQLVQDIANLMAGAITQTGTTRNYGVEFGARTGSLPGAADDYAYSRHRADNTKKKVIAYTLESGDGVMGFRPVFDTEFPTIRNEIHAAILRFLVWIVDNRTSPPPPQPQPQRRCCIFVILAGASLSPAVEFLRAIRDVWLRETTSGRRFSDALQRVYSVVSPPLARLLDRHELLRHATAALLFRPGVALLRAAHARTSRFRSASLRVNTLIIAIAAPLLVLLAVALAAIM